MNFNCMFVYHHQSNIIVFIKDISDVPNHADILLSIQIKKYIKTYHTDVKHETMQEISHKLIPTSWLYNSS